MRPVGALQRAACLVSQLRQSASVQAHATPSVAAAAHAWGSTLARAAGAAQHRLLFTSGSRGASEARPTAAAAAAPQQPEQQQPVEQQQQQQQQAAFIDLPAKLALFAEAGLPQENAAQRYAPFLCSPVHHMAVRFAFLRSRGKLRPAPFLPKVICPSDAELCAIHGECEEELAAFKRAHLSSYAWRKFCERHGVVQAQPGT